MLEVLFVSPEVAPFSKTGGLADVGSSLPKALSELGINVTIITPLYQMVDRKNFSLKKCEMKLVVPLGGTSKNFEIWEGTLNKNVKVLLLAQDEFFNRENLYGTKTGDYPDNYLRFSFFSFGVIELIKILKLKPDLIHVNDWQTALIPLYNREFLFNSFKTVLTVHNIGYQGIFSPDIIPQIGLDWRLFNPEEIEFYGKVNILKAGLVTASRITTVSPQYAIEIQQPQFGYGLDGVLRKRGDVLYGILNGVDYSEWDPATDNLISSRYSIEDLTGKKACKKELRKHFKLPLNPDIPVIGMMGRIAGQKGLDLIALAMDEIVKMNVQLVILGTGEKPLEDMLIEETKKYPDNVSVNIAFDNELAHLIEAGSDFFLMPSKYEPCGLNQLYSFRYGTIPIVHAVGGLEDTVIDLNENEKNGTGFKFRSYNINAMLEKINYALTLYKEKNKLETIIKRIMKLDFSWKESGKKYVDLYKGLVEEII